MAKEEKKPFHQSMAEWRQFIYNRNSGEFLGRTAKSWGKGEWRERAPGAQRRGGRVGGTGWVDLEPLPPWVAPD